MTVKTVYIEITNRCNFNCKTCYNRSGLNRKTEEIPVEKIREIIELFSSFGAKRFLFSGGEPTLHSQFNKLLDLLKEFPDYSFGFVTNGSSENEKFIDFLKNADNVTLQISLDGSCEEENAKTRGIGNFKKAIDFAVKTQNPIQPTLLKMVVSQKNTSDVENFYRLAISIGCTPEIAFIYRSGNGEDDWEEKKLSSQEKFKILLLIDKLNKEYKTDAHLPRCTVTCPFVKGTENMSLCIKTDGSIQPCQTLYSSDFTIGNINEFDNNEFLDKISSMITLAKKRASLDFGCTRCAINKLCGRGCLAEAVNNVGDPLGNDESCLFRKLQFFNFDLNNPKMQN
ncbi:MAG: radical SAM protein [Ruminococcaceae bacterium]|nr:radical SAM protein [Oscillospiraceae bacterium]